MSFWGLRGSDLVLEHLEAGRSRSPQPKTSLSRGVQGLSQGRGFGRPQHLLAGHRSPASRWALPQRGPAALSGSVPTPSHAAASPRSVPSHRYPPRGLLPSPAPRGCTPPGQRYLGLSKLHPLRRSAALFCRRSAAAAPPGSCSIAPGGGRRLGHTRVGSGLGGVRPDAQLARRSPHPAPHPSLDPSPASVPPQTPAQPRTSGPAPNSSLTTPSYSLQGLGLTSTLSDPLNTAQALGPAPTLAA